MPIRSAVHKQRHPEIITGTTKPWSKSPSGSDLYEWQESYPDGSIRTYREEWHTVTGASGTTYGGIRVAEVATGVAAYSPGA